MNAIQTFAQTGQLRSKTLTLMLGLPSDTAVMKPLAVDWAQNTNELTKYQAT